MASYLEISYRQSGKTTRMMNEIQRRFDNKELDLAIVAVGSGQVKKYVQKTFFDLLKRNHPNVILVSSRRQFEGALIYNHYNVHSRVNIFVDDAECNKWIWDAIEEHKEIFENSYFTSSEQTWQIREFCENHCSSIFFCLSKNCL